MWENLQKQNKNSKSLQTVYTKEKKGREEQRKEKHKEREETGGRKKGGKKEKEKDVSDSHLCFL